MTSNLGHVGENVSMAVTASQFVLRTVLASVQLCGVIIVAIGGAALAGYATHHPMLYAWTMTADPITAMAPNTAFCFILSGGSLFAMATIWDFDLTPMPFALTIVHFLAMLVAALCVIAIVAGWPVLGEAVLMPLVGYYLGRIGMWAASVEHRDSKDEEE